MPDKLATMEAHQMNARIPHWDTIISNALVFDGTGAAPEQIDIAIKQGKIVAKGQNLPLACANEIM